MFNLLNVFCDLMQFMMKTQKPNPDLKICDENSKTKSTFFKSFYRQMSNVIFKLWTKKVILNKYYDDIGSSY